MKTKKIAIIGLGYVGLPLAVEFGHTELAPVIGYNRSQDRVEELERGKDRTEEVDLEKLKSAQIEFTADPGRLKEADFVICTVPTPIDEDKRPDLTAVKSASKTIGENLKKEAIVVFESTVYPGVIEDICAPIIEKASGLKCGTDWKIGYSPERVNPGDKEHTIDKIVKIVSGMDEETLNEVAEVYSLIIKAGVHRAPNIKTAEAAKVIENVQRDLNIALANELSLIFHKLDINTKEVMEAAGTKWNFHKYQPGMVGGHCIGVDPYYLTHRALELGYDPQVILAGRRINDYMPEYVAELMINGLTQAGKKVSGAKVLIMGLTFKENCNDVRNSKTKIVIQKLKEHNIEVLGHDPLISEKEVNNFSVKNQPDLNNLPKVDGVVLTVTHDDFKKMTLEKIIGLMDGPGVLIDVKSYYLNEARNSDIIYKCL